jgi:hypothetical protein
MGGSREYVHTNQQAPYVRGPDIFVKNIGLLVSIKFGHKIRRGRTLISSYIIFDKSIGFGVRGAGRQNPILEASSNLLQPLLHGMYAWITLDF